VTVEILGLWELGWNTPIKEIDLWEFVIKEFAVDHLYMCPVSGIETGGIPIREISEANLEQFFNDKRATGIQIVFIDDEASPSLETFTHPSNVLYVFGKVTASLYPSYRTSLDQSVVIPTIINQGTMWPHQCAAIILYDRFKKLPPV
jgi:tRNA(Leu) C34 or U34 (ribose-2'-O)-methylase TrmL